MAGLRKRIQTEASYNAGRNKKRILIDGFPTSFDVTTRPPVRWATSNVLPFFPNQATNKPAALVYNIQTAARSVQPARSQPSPSSAQGEASMGCCKRELAGGPRLREQRRRRLLPLLLLLLILAVVADPPLAAASFFFGGDADSVRLFTILTITRTRPAPPLTILPLLFRAQDCSRTCESERCTGKSPRVASSDRGRWLDFFCFFFYLSVRPTDRLTALPCTPSLAAAPLMRYGKYCGVSYTGCPGEDPCDALDACCMIHDACVQATDSTTSASIYTF
jgi:hypothetical protein